MDGVGLAIAVVLLMSIFWPSAPRPEPPPRRFYANRIELKRRTTEDPVDWGSPYDD
ncbi:hypothetical protein [Lyngbya sp. PCC 8106]|uniref:hypothetical protein n=1 Tax=Lyngbya sp. (strain PCC 8106) TaxID=313612 RepID=UPI0002DEA92E|nr:hypothetical protein [Lyngbya sp. PCC 8106]